MSPVKWSKVYSESQKQRVAALWSIPRLEPLKLSEENAEVQFYDIGFQKWILRCDTKCMRSKMKKHNVGEPRKHHARWGKPATKDHILWFHLYEMSTIGKSRDKERRLMVTWLGASQVVQWYRFRLPTHEKLVRYQAWDDPLGKEMAIYFSILAWEIPWTEGPGRLQPMGLQSQTWLSPWTHTHKAGVGRGEVVVDTVSVNVHPLGFLLVCWIFSKMDCGYACLTLQTH